MASLGVRWQDLSATLQTEILYNMGTDEAEDWPEIISRLGLTQEEEENAVKHIRRRASQDYAEEKFLMKQQRRQRDYLLGRNRNTIPASTPRECPPALPPLPERLKMPEFEYYLCSKKELMVARRFLKSHRLDPELAGDWGIPSEELDSDDSDDNDAHAPSILPKNDFGFGVTPTVNMKSVTGAKEEETDTNSLVDFLNGFTRESTKEKSQKEEMQVPLIPLLNSAYENKRDKHMRRLRRTRAKMDFTLQQTPGPVLSPVERPQVRLTVDDMGAADIESSPPYDMIPLPSSPATINQLSEREEGLSPQDTLALQSVPLWESETSDDDPRSSPVGGDANAGERLSGDGISVRAESTSAGSTKGECGTGLRTPIPAAGTITTTSLNKVESASKKRGRKRQHGRIGKGAETAAPSQDTPTSKTFRPIIEIPAVRANMGLRKKAAMGRTAARMSSADEIAPRSSKMQTRRLKSVVTFAEAEEASSTETPTSQTNEDAFDNVPNRSIKKSRTEVSQSTQSNAATAVNSAMTMKRRKRLTSSAIALSRPYSLRSNSLNEFATAVEIEEARVKQMATEGMGTLEMVTRRTTRRKSGL